MFWKLFAFIAFISAGAASPVDRLRYLTEKISTFLPSSSSGRSETIALEDRQSIIDSMVQYVSDETSALENFVSVLSSALRCGLTASDIDSYKWDVFSALYSRPVSTDKTDDNAQSVLKKREASAVIDDESIPRKISRMPQDSTVLIEEVLNESVEPVSTTSEPVISSNLSHESSLRLMGNLKSYTDRFHQRDLRDSEWGYLRAIQGLRAAKMDYAAIREDFYVLEDMHVPALHIANIFSLAQSIMSKGLLAPIQPPRMPGFIAKEIATPLLKRLDAYYNRFASISFTNQYSELSTRLARYVKDGDIIRVTNALNLAILASVRAVDVRPIFYEAYKALGGTN